MNQKQLEVLQEVLAVLGLASQAAVQIGGSIGNPEVVGGAELAALLTKLAQKGVAALEVHQGEPIDLSLLHPIDPIA